MVRQSNDYEGQIRAFGGLWGCTTKICSLRNASCSQECCVRFGSLADIPRRPGYVRFTVESGHSSAHRNAGGGVITAEREADKSPRTQEIAERVSSNSFNFPRIINQLQIYSGLYPQTHSRIGPGFQRPRANASEALALLWRSVRHLWIWHARSVAR